MHTLINIIFGVLNSGLTVGLLLGALWLIGPITRRLLTPVQRLLLWGAGWICVLNRWLGLFAGIRILPITLRDLITPRGNRHGVALYFPERYTGPGRYELTLPGDILISMQLTDAIVMGIALVWLVGVCGMICLQLCSSRSLKRVAAAGEQIAPGHALYSTYEQLRGQDVKTVWTRQVDMFLCDNTPTSFIYAPLVGPTMICLQKGLSPQRLALVLRHELNHFRLCHCYLKFYCSIALTLYWWNPLIWMAWFATCRDMELDCDRRTVAQLDLPQQREYAHTLLELSCGRQLWDAPLCFAESDAGHRIRAIADRKTRSLPGRFAAGGLALAVFLFCFTAGGSTKEQKPEEMPSVGQSTGTTR